MIHCTGVNSDVSAIQFNEELERIVGYTLGTADLLGQMAADDYVDKLPTLFSEFAEAVEFSKDQSQYIARFKSPEDLVRKLPSFGRRLFGQNSKMILAACIGFSMSRTPTARTPTSRKFTPTLAGWRRRRWRESPRPEAAGARGLARLSCLLRFDLGPDFVVEAHFGTEVFEKFQFGAEFRRRI